MPRHPLTNFEIQKYSQSKPKFNGVYLRYNLAKVKDGTYVINLDEYKSIGTYWITLYVNVDKVIYFHSFEFEHNPKEILKNQLKNFCIEFIDFRLRVKSFLDYTKYFQNLLFHIK